MPVHEIGLETLCQFTGVSEGVWSTIPLLVRYFMDLCAKSMNKSVERISKKAMQVLLTHTWLGNVRELRNFIELAIILSPSKVLRGLLDGLKSPAANPRVSGHRGADSNQSTKEMRDTMMKFIRGFVMLAGIITTIGLIVWVKVRSGDRYGMEREWRE